MSSCGLVIRSQSPIRAESTVYEADGEWNDFSGIVQGKVKHTGDSFGMNPDVGARNNERHHTGVELIAKSHVVDSHHLFN